MENQASPIEPIEPVVKQFSTIAIIGIVVGSVLGALTLILIVYFIAKAASKK